MTNFRGHLQKWRLFRGMTQEDLARRSGIPRPNLVALEQGRRECTLSTLNRLSYALGITPGRILDQLPPRHRGCAVGRYQIDRIARNLLLGRPLLAKRFLEVRNHAAREAIPLLRAVGVKVSLRRRGRAAGADRETTQEVLKKMTRLLASQIREGVP